MSLSPICLLFCILSFGCACIVFDLVYVTFVAYQDELTMRGRRDKSLGSVQNHNPISFGIYDLNRVITPLQLTVHDEDKQNP
jgi:hypothetical protein